MNNRLKMNDDLREYLQSTSDAEIALKNRVRQLYEQKDALKGYGEIEGGVANSWTRFIHRFTKNKKKPHTMAELKAEYQKYKATLAKSRVVAKKKPVKKVAVKKVAVKKVAVKKVAPKNKSGNPWLKFLADYRKKNPGFSDQRALVAAAAVDYKQLTGRGFDKVNPQNLTGDDLDNYIDNYKGYDEDVDDPRLNDAYLSDLCSNLYGDDREGGYGTKAGAKKNKWIAFLKKKSNKGKTRAQVLNLYKQQNAKKKAPAKKKVAVKKRVVKKKTAKKITVKPKHMTDALKKKLRKTIGNGVLFDY